MTKKTSGCAATRCRFLGVCQLCHAVRAAKLAKSWDKTRVVTPASSSQVARICLLRNGRQQRAFDRGILLDRGGRGDFLALDCLRKLCSRWLAIEPTVE